MYKRLRILIVLLLTVVPFFISININAQNSYYVINYTSRNGLPQNSIKSMILDSTGFLWLATESGLVRFDGINFKVNNTLNTPELLSDRIFELHKTFNNEIVMSNTFGSLYKVTSNGIQVLAAGKRNTISFYTLKGILPTADFYIKTNNPDFSLFKQNQITYSPLAIFPISTTNYYTRTVTGFAFFDGFVKQSEINLKEMNPKLFFKIGKQLFFFSKSNELFLISPELNGITACKIEGDLPEVIRKTNAIVDHVFNDENNSDNCLLIKNYLLDFSFNPQSLTLSTKIICDKLPENTIIYSLVYNKRKHFIAVGTDTKGLFIYKEQNVKTLRYLQPEVNTNNAYYAQIVLDSNTILTNWQREFSPSGAKKSNKVFAGFDINTIHKDNQNNIWYGLKGKFYKYELNSNQNKLIDSIRGNQPHALFDEGNSIWIGTEKNISYVKGDIMYPFYEIKNNNFNTIPLSILRGPDSLLWFCNFTGVFRLNTSNHNIDTIQELSGQFARVLYLVNDLVFIGTYGSGYYVYQNNKITKMPLDRNNNLSQVHAFISDTNGYLWMSTNKGLYKAHLNEISHYLSDSTTEVYYYYYGEENGIENIEFNGGNDPPVVALNNGYFSFPSMDGLVWFNPYEMITINASEKIIIDQVLVNGEKVNYSDALYIPAGTQNITIDFATSYWGSSNNLLLEYMLSGYHKLWQPINAADRSLIFSNLPYGNYQLVIRKKSGFGPDNFESIMLPISVMPRYYETLWFKLFLFLCLLLLLVVVSRLYAANIKKRNLVLELKVEERTKELSFVNEQLLKSVSVKDKLISILSHDIITPLRFITMVARKGGSSSNVNEVEQLHQIIDDIKNASQKLHNNAQNILNWIKHQNKRITVNYNHVAVAALADEVTELLLELASSKQIEIINNISSDDIIKTDKNILAIILNNLFSNAIKFTTKGRITIDAKHDMTNYIITVSDTGTGMSSEQIDQIQHKIKSKIITAANPSSGSNGNGLGYIIISELIEILHGTFTIESALNKGTTVQIIIPLKNF